MTTEQAAESIRGSHSKISRMEHGRVGFKERDIADLLTLYGVGPGDEREALLSLARGANTPGWWQAYADILPHWVEPYFGLEAAASFIREYELQFVPGLLQIEDYARAVIRLGTLTSEDEIDRRAKARMSRQEILNRENPPKVWAILDEGALRRVIGGPRGHAGPAAAPDRDVRSPGRDAADPALLRGRAPGDGRPVHDPQVHRARPARCRLHRAADQRPVPGQADRGRRLPRGDRGGLPPGRPLRQDPGHAQGPSWTTCSFRTYANEEPRTRKEGVRGSSYLSPAPIRRGRGWGWPW